MAKGKIRVGIGGWSFEPWRGVFYPKGLAQCRELEYASRAFPTIEINGSFYSLQRPLSYAAWYADTPPGFVFSIKGGRYITHMLRLVNAEAALANFFASGIFNRGAVSVAVSAAVPLSRRTLREFLQSTAARL